MIGTVGIPYLVAQKKVNFAIKNIGLFRTSEVPEYKNYFIFLLKSSGMKSYLEARVAGTTQKYLSLKTLRSIEFIDPPRTLLDAFNSSLNPIIESSFSTISESQQLAELRDTLLPKLLSGKLSPTTTEAA